MSDSEHKLCRCSKCGSTKLQETYFSKNVKGQYFKTCDKCRSRNRGKRHTIEECKEFAISEGGDCLSTEYKTNKIKLKWSCSENHEWEANFGNILKGHWCPYCTHSIPKTLQQCQEFAISKGGECLSTEYKNSKTKMKWKCKEGHEWDTCFNAVNIGGTWCKICAYKVLNRGLCCMTLQQCQEFAISKGGECLSAEYKNNRTKMKWKCKEGHVWDACVDGIKTARNWCKACSGTGLITIEDCRTYALSKGGKCLSTEYKPNKKIRWKCHNNHEWDVWFNRSSTSWCRECNRITIQDCQEIALLRKGQCLSTEFENCHKKMKWKCNKGHIWDAALKHIKYDSTWCPNCSSFRSEALAREILEEETGHQWGKIRPKWLKGLELDGYCKELNTAFEYQGEQHYRYVPHFHRKGEEDFHKQQERDKRKLELTTKKGIRIIYIPYKYDFRKPEEMRQYLKNQLPSSDSDSEL